MSLLQESSKQRIDLVLTQVLSELASRPPLEQREVMATLIAPSKNERDKDIERKRDDRSASARIVIPPCKNMPRRLACLADPVLFLRTYFADRYTLDFGPDHLFMIDAIVSRARYGGRQAVAAPRGRGKSEIVKGLLVYLVCSQLVRFILPVAATTPLAKMLYRDFRKKFAANDMLLDDFPEICQPIRALEGAPLRAHKQHVDSQLTNIVWTDDYISLPCVPGSPYGGVKMAYYGLDSAFRGANIDGDRPDFVLVDDPETSESAKSHMQIDDREKMLDQDISGLASQEESLAIVVLTTVQNNYCLSARITDRKIKPSYNGKRFGMVLSWPANTDLWQTYISLRHESQIAGDEHGTKAVDYYETNRERMDEGVEMLSEHFKSIEVDGRQMVLSAIQQTHNQIADTSRDAYFTEYQNDPPASTGPVGAGLTPIIVMSRINGLARLQLPASAVSLTAAIDLGKYSCHWVIIAWWKGAGGCIVDYGVQEVHNQERHKDRATDMAASEPQIYKALLDWRTGLLDKTFVDGSGAERRVDAVFVDSGTYSNAAYEFCRQVGSPFHCSKGIGNYRERTKSTNDIMAGDHMHSAKLDAQQVWLFDLDVNYWKNWVHERFLTPTFDADNMLTQGSLSLYSGGRQNHLSYAHHICAEELVTEFREGKGTKTYWNVVSDNNHWLDATTYAAAAGRYAGVKLMANMTTIENKPKAVQANEQQQRQQPARKKHGPNIRSRSGGWIKGLRGRHGG